MLACQTHYMTKILIEQNTFYIQIIYSKLY